MKHYVREVGFVLLLLILQTSTFLDVYANSGFTIESTNLQIYRDGLVNIKQILNITEQQSLWSMLDKIVEFRQSELDDIISKNKSDRVSRRIATKMFIEDVKEKLPKQSKEIEDLLDKNGLHLYDQ